jgi:hypothetical protein
VSQRRLGGIILLCGRGIDIERFPKNARYLLTGLGAMLDEDPKKASAVAGQSETSSNNNLHNLTRGIENGRTPADSLKRIKDHHWQDRVR